MSVQAIEAKKLVVSEIAEKFKNAQSAVVVEYRGLTVGEVTELRRKLRAESVELKVYKNTMAQRAAESVGYADLNSSLVGPNAIAFANDDAVAPAKVLVEFGKKHKALVVKAGVVEGKVVNDEVIKELSSLPNRDGMYSMLLSCFQSPIRSFALAVKAISEKEDGAEEAPVEAE